MENAWCFCPLLSFKELLSKCIILKSFKNIKSKRVKESHVNFYLLMVFDKTYLLKETGTAC